MAYVSRGRKPIERASKIVHAEIISNPTVQEYIARCKLPSAATSSDIARQITRLPEEVDPGDLRAVIALDGGFTEVPIQETQPFATIAFYTFGPLLLNLAELDEVDAKEFIAPEDIARLKKLERYTFVLPLRGIRFADHRSLTDTVRRTIYDFFIEERGAERERLIDSLKWFLFREWKQGGEEIPASVAWCPDTECAQENIEFSSDTDTVLTCPSCGHDVYLTDVFRLHERVYEEQGAGAITAYVLGVLEQMVLVHLIRSILDIKSSLLREVMFIKDGPLAFFGLVAPLCRPMRELMTHLLPNADDAGAPRIRLAGIEKTGAFVEHAETIRNSMPLGSVLVCSNEYIYNHIVPGDGLTSLYGSNTYYGQKVIFRSSSGEMYVVTAPAPDYSANPTFEDIPDLDKLLGIVSKLRCSMYDNALLPIALVNKLVSLSDVPSQRILKAFARQAIGG